MRGLLANSHHPTTYNEGLENNPYFCLVLLSNLEDLAIPVDYISGILGCFGTFLSIISLTRWYPTGCVGFLLIKTNFI